MDERNLTIENNGTKVVPIWTWKNVPENIVIDFKDLSREKYGNSYWAALLSLMHKAELYDTLYVKLNGVEETVMYLLNEVEKLKEETKGKEGPKTFR